MTGRRKMSLMEQAAFIRGLAERCEAGPPDHKVLVYQSVNLLTAAEYENLSIVAETLQFLDVHGAEQLVRDKFHGRKGRR